ncbi:MAG: TlpA disulfide reductase family protein [Alistipes shahii]
MIDGSKVALSELRGKVVLLSFWATWCPPCREELSHVQQQVIDRFAGEEFVFLPISRGEERAAVEAFRAKRATPSRWGSTRTRRSTSAMRPVSSRATF